MKIISLNKHSLFNGPNVLQVSKTENIMHAHKLVNFTRLKTKILKL